MARSLRQRVFRMVLLVNLVVLGSILLFSWWALEDLEQTMLASDHDAEIQFFAEHGDRNRLQHVVTAQVVSLFVPNSLLPGYRLPAVFADIPAPYEGEVIVDGREYFVISTLFPEGHFYLAKDLRLFEARETRLTLYITLLALLLAASCVVLAIIFSRRIAQPVRAFAGQIDNLNAGGTALSLSEQHVDAELNAIAAAFNRLLRDIEAARVRERNLIALASHELRTPVAVVLGAARIMESRRQLQADDARTLQRIIVAADAMAENIRALLALVRQDPGQLQQVPVDLHGLLEQIVQDYRLQDAGFAERLQLQCESTPGPVSTDLSLVRMLFNNLIGNALQHTQGPVTIVEHADRVDVVDRGNLLAAGGLMPADFRPTSGLGLYIVGLICDHLGWRIDLSADRDGQRVTIRFTRQD